VNVANDDLEDFLADVMDHLNDFGAALDGRRSGTRMMMRRTIPDAGKLQKR
jgi:hypothetical protein